MEYLNHRITIDEKICKDKMTIRGERIAVNAILEFLSADDCADDILKQYQSLEKEDIAACLKLSH